MLGGRISSHFVINRFYGICTAQRHFRGLDARSQPLLVRFTSRAVPGVVCEYCTMFPIAGDGGPSWPQLYLTAVGSAALGAIGSRAWEAWRGKRQGYTRAKRQKLNDDPDQPPTPEPTVDKASDGLHTTATAATAPDARNEGMPVPSPSEAPDSHVGHSNSAVDLQKLQELEQRVCVVPHTGPGCSRKRQAVDSHERDASGYAISREALVEVQNTKPIHTLNVPDILA
jgi:hypothetical protein